MPIFTHELDGVLQSGVAGLPVVGAAATNPLALAAVLVTVIAVVAMFSVRPGDGRFANFARTVAFGYLPALAFVHVYGAAVAARAARVHGGGEVRSFVSAPVRPGVTFHPGTMGGGAPPAPPQYAPAQPQPQQYPVAQPQHHQYPPAPPPPQQHAQAAPQRATLSMIERRVG
jgi:hypothetical protein